MKFTDTHEWVRLQGQIAVVGISDYAQKEVGEIVHVELPQVGAHVEAECEIVILESTKAAIDIYTPLSGEIVEVNLALKDHPQLINLSAEDKGWLYKIKVKNMAEYERLNQPAKSRNI